MKLSISDAGERLIRDFASFVGGTVECASLEITVSASHVSIIFSQPERYSRLVSCEFKFSSDVGFLYEDICAAFCACGRWDQAGRVLLSDPVEEMIRNDRYLMEVIDTCKNNWAEIVRMPPFWFEKAVEISDKDVRRNFPEIADEDLENKVRLLNRWRDQSNH